MVLSVKFNYYEKSKLLGQVRDVIHTFDKASSESEKKGRRKRTAPGIPAREIAHPDKVGIRLVRTLLVVLNPTVLKLKNC